MRVHGTFTMVFKVWKDISTIPAVRDVVVQYDYTWSILSNARQLLPNIDSSHIKSGNASIAHLRTYLTITANREDNITIARAFILFMIRHLWFQTANNTVSLGYLTAMNDLDSAAQYNGGSAIFDSLYHGLDTAVTIGGAITGFVQFLLYWFYEYCGVGHPIVKEELKGEERILLDPPLREERETYTSCWAEQTSEVGYMLADSQRMGNIDLFELTVLRAGITFVVVMLASVHRLSQDFSLPGEEEGPDLRWHMEWTGRRERLPIARLWDLPPMSSSCDAEELWHLTHGLSSSSSDDDLIFNCAAAICVLHQAAVNIIVEDATSSYDGSVIGHKDKRKKRDHPLGHYSIIRGNFKPNYAYEPWEFQ
ncbi:hypothetical protein GIB67_028637 [Kingdonia uniflora]|uniref:Uncharacterized protein n=1 Tax=Kingdonia uniflora TaxID=39325 RepID=A0A7J7KZI1_9MAGN|nr:hypothetical protein GIB67_028637 [Kingdonia uniflora]